MFLDSGAAIAAPFPTSSAYAEYISLIDGINLSLVISCNKIVTVCAAVCKGLRSVQNVVLERTHHLIQFAKQGHQVADTKLFCIGANRTAGDAVIARAFIS